MSFGGHPYANKKNSSSIWNDVKQLKTKSGTEIWETILSNRNWQIIKTCLINRWNSH